MSTFRHVIAALDQDLGLRRPQRSALENLDTALAAIPALPMPIGAVEGKVPVRTFERFDTRFPSFCFQLATAVGKTKLMAACIAYLYQTRQWRNFFILTKGTTVYTKTIANFTPGNPKYVLESYTELPDLMTITGDNYERQEVARRLDPNQLHLTGEYVNIFVFNVEKLWVFGNSRGGAHIGSGLI